MIDSFPTRGVFPESCIHFFTVTTLTILRHRDDDDEVVPVPVFKSAVRTTLSAARPRFTPSSGDDATSVSGIGLSLFYNPEIMELLLY